MPWKAGDFIELEEVLREDPIPSASPHGGEGSTVREIMEKLGIREEDLLDRAYVDMKG